LVKDFKWLDISKLDGFVSDVKEILKRNKLLTLERIDKICMQIQKRVDNVKNYN